MTVPLEAGKTLNLHRAWGTREIAARRRATGTCAMFRPQRSNGADQSLTKESTCLENTGLLEASGHTQLLRDSTLSPSRGAIHQDLP